MKIAYWQVDGGESLFSIFRRTLGHFDGPVSVRLFLTVDRAGIAHDLTNQIWVNLVSADVIDSENQIRTFSYYRAECKTGEKDRIAIIIQEVE